MTTRTGVVADAVRSEHSLLARKRRGVGCCARRLGVSPRPRWRAVPGATPATCRRPPSRSCTTTMVTRPRRSGSGGARPAPRTRRRPRRDDRLAGEPRGPQRRRGHVPHPPRSVPGDRRERGPRARDARRRARAGALATRYPTESNNGDAFSPESLARGAPLHVVTAEPGCGTWRAHAVIPARKLRTLQRGTEPASVLPGASAHEPYLEELAQMSVNVQTAGRARGRSATTVKPRWCSTRRCPRWDAPRYSCASTAASTSSRSYVPGRRTRRSPRGAASRTSSPSSSSARPAPRIDHRSPVTVGQLTARQTRPQRRRRRVVRQRGVDVGEGRGGCDVRRHGETNAGIPTGAAIFKNVAARGFWLTRWLEDRRMEEEASVHADPSVVPWAHGSFMPPSDSAYAKGKRHAMATESSVATLIRAVIAEPPTPAWVWRKRSTSSGRARRWGRGKTMIWMRE